MALGEIVFSARIYYPPGDKRVSRFQIYCARPDGSGRLALTTSDADNLDPKWSPDGRQILFWQSGKGGELTLCVTGAGGFRPVAAFGSAGYAWMASWLPDSRRVALARGGYGGDARNAVEIWDTRSARRVARYENATEYAVSPSGDRVYLDDRKAGRLVYLAEAGRVAPLPALSSPLWLDEKTLVGLEYGEQDAGDGFFGVRSLVVADDAGKVLRRVTPRDAPAARREDDGPVAALSLARAAPGTPDALLLYSEHRDLDWYALLSVADGTVTRARTGFKKPVWSPDGKQFVTYASRGLAPYGTGGKQVYVGPVYVGTDLTRPARKITPGLSWCGGVDWRG
jgi:dipeptidyl aminopeptidase/acylaminoacyl peptidase